MTVEISYYDVRLVSLSRNGSGGGLYMECTTTPGSSTVIYIISLWSVFR